MAGNNWWFDNQERNNLAGIVGDPTNPAILPDHIILDLLISIPIAKEDFLKIVPLMSAPEQARLNGLIDRCPLALQPFPYNDQQIDDRFMKGLNTPGVRDPNRKRK